MGTSVLRRSVVTSTVSTACFVNQMIKDVLVGEAAELWKKSKSLEVSLRLSLRVRRVKRRPVIIFVTPACETAHRTALSTSSKTILFARTGWSRQNPDTSEVCG